MTQDAHEAQSHANRLIDGLARTTGLDNLVFDEIGCCNLMIDEQEMTIGFDDAALDMFLMAPVMTVPVSPSQDFYVSVLEDNFTAYFNSAGCIALDGDENHIVWLDRRTLGKLDQRSFEAWLLEGVGCAEFWARELQQRVNSAELASAAPALAEASNDEKVFRV
ncbi:type III secretion system chaperone [Labrenzia sp. OB1]|uniref:type III secretion system chaperone n=1 Tax=Labrenzia sp. OB1 TaxID=1561204 RepID=UPI0007B222B5|nr:type III secretion system chaperone [Labrenzia sp. OB1]KZM47352.1 hypothetical protein OA90_26370 [Labrenzia sp. OB1]